MVNSIDSFPAITSSSTTPESITIRQDSSTKILLALLISVMVDVWIDPMISIE